MTEEKRTERGAAAVIVAGSLVFLFGMAALAVDTSGFYQTARVAQTTADLACLAGVAEVPDTDAAIEMAHAYAVGNWPEMASTSLPGSGNPRQVSDGNGNTVTYEVDGDIMRVSISDRDPTTFGRVLGSQSVDVSQEAACKREASSGGPGIFPFGALPGVWNGLVHDCTGKGSNCGSFDVGSGANDLRDAVIDGWDQPLQKHHGDRDDPDPDTGATAILCPTAPDPCSRLITEPGNNNGGFKGITTRLSDTDGASCIDDGYNCDSLAQVLGSTEETLKQAQGNSEPDWWEESLYGAYSAVRNSQYYFDGNIAKCDSPRLITVPIVSFNLDWDLGDPPGPNWPNGKPRSKVVGFYLAYIAEPVDVAKYKWNKDPLVVEVIHLGPNATCDGLPYNPFGAGVPIETVKLVTP